MCAKLSCHFKRNFAEGDLVDIDGVNGPSTVRWVLGHASWFLCRTLADESTSSSWQMLWRIRTLKVGVSRHNPARSVSLAGSLGLLVVQCA